MYEISIYITFSEQDQSPEILTNYTTRLKFVVGRQASRYGEELQKT
jgi:hypothetical protein